MATDIKFKRSAVPGKSPNTAQLSLGEIAINTYDGTLYTERNDGAITIRSFPSANSSGSYETLNAANVEVSGGLSNSSGYLFYSNGQVNATTIYASNVTVTNFESTTITIVDIESNTITANVVTTESFSTNTSTLSYANVENWIDFTAIDHPAHNEGRLFYDNVHKTLNYNSDISNLQMELGTNEYIRVYNDTGSLIPKGTALFLSGYFGTNPVVPKCIPADASSLASYNTSGLASASIAAGSYGYCTVSGVITGSNSDPFDTSGLTAGERAFVSASTPGDLQQPAPSYPNYPMCMGLVVVSDANSGVFVVEQQMHAVPQFRVAGDAYIGADLTVAGDLSVLGTETTTTLTNISVADTFFYLGTGDTISNTVFTGTGLDDALYEDYYNGTETKTYSVRIDGVGTGTGGVDTFEWSVDNFTTTEATGVDITGDAQLLEDHIKIHFTATTGHTSGDRWDGDVAPSNLDFGITGNYSNSTLYSHAGMFRDASDQEFKFFKRYDPEVEGSIDTSNSTFQYADLRANSFFGHTITANVIGSVTGTVSDISNHLSSQLTFTNNITFSANTIHNGRVGIKVSTPQEALSVNGNIVSDSSIAVGDLFDVSTDSVGTYPLEIKTNTDLMAYMQGRGTYAYAEIHANGAGFSGLNLSANGQGYTSLRHIRNASAPFTYVSNGDFLVTTSGGSIVFAPNGNTTSLIKFTNGVISGNGSSITSVDAATVGGNTASALLNYNNFTNTPTIPANTSTSSAAYADANTTLTFTRADSTTYDVDLSSVGGLPSTIAIANTTGLAIANGAESFAIGSNTEATGFYSIAMGWRVFAHDNYGVAIGSSSNSEGQYGIAIGTQAKAIANNTIAIGLNANASPGESIAIGNAARPQRFSGNTSYAGICIGTFSEIGANASYSLAIGYNATVANNSKNSTLVGYGAQVSSLATNANNATVVGASATANGRSATAIGAYSYSNTNGTAAGVAASARGQESVALGYAANSDYLYSVAIGSQAAANGSGTIALGRFANAQSGPYGGATGPGTISIGESSYATNGSITIGQDSSAEGQYSAAFGVNAVANANYAVAIGYLATASDANTIVLGTNAIDTKVEGNLTVYSGRVISGNGASITSVDAATVGGNTAADLLNYNNFTNTPTIPANTSLNGATWYDANNTLRFVREDATSTDVNISFSEYVNPANTSLSSAAWADANNTLTFTRADATTTDVQISFSEYVNPANTSVSNGTFYVANSTLILTRADTSTADITVLESVKASGAASSLSGGSKNIAIGSGADAGNTYDIAIGSDAGANATAAVAIGAFANAISANAIAIGRSANASTNAGITIGANAQLNTGLFSDGGIAIGRNSYTDRGGVAIGQTSEAGGIWGTAIGFAATANGSASSIAIGSSQATDEAAISIGLGAAADGNSAIAIGQGANVQHDFSTAIGYGATTTAANTIVIGDLTQNTVIGSSLSVTGVISGNGSSITSVNAIALNGLAAGSFLRSNVADTATANITFEDSSLVFSNTGSSLNDWNMTAQADGDFIITMIATGGAEFEFSSNGSSYQSAALTIGGNRALTVADEGSGNGLDADTLDGIQGSSFLRSDVADTALKVITFSANTIHNGRVGIGNSTPGHNLSVTGNGQFTTDLTVGRDLTISGNLTVSGTTTTINTTEMTVNDAVITLNSGQATPLNDIGLLMQRYSTANSTNYNVGIVWDESADQIVIGSTPEDGNDNDISVSDAWMTVNGDVAAFTTNTSFYSGATQAEFNIGRSIDQKLRILVQDGRCFIDHTQDETDATDHSVLFRINSSSTGANLFDFQRPILASNGDVTISGSNLNIFDTATSLSSSVNLGPTNARYWSITGQAYNSTDNTYDLDINNPNYLGHITFGSNNAVRMKVSANGNIGIGNTTPTTKLAVEGTGYFSTNVGIGTASVGNGLLNLRANADNNWITMNNGSETAFNFRIYNDGTGDGTNTAFTRMGIDYGGSRNATVNFYRGGSGVGGFLTFTSNNDTERMRIAANGNIGIGTTSPSELLHVEGRLRLGTTPSIVSHDNITIDIDQNNNQTTNYFRVTKDGEASELFRVHESGYVGIANTTSNAGLTIGNTLGAILEGDSQASYGAGLKFRNSGYAHYTVGNKGSDFVIATTSSDGSQVWDASPSLKVVVTTNGNVGIGNTAPGHKLSVGGNVMAHGYGFYTSANANGADDRAGIEYGGAHSTLHIVSDALIQFKESDANAVKATVDVNNGRMRIGDSNSPVSNTLEVVGSVNVSATIHSSTINTSDLNVTDLAVFSGQHGPYESDDRSAYWDYDTNIAAVFTPAADNGATAILFPSIGNNPSDFAYIAYDEDYPEAGVTAGEAGALILSSQNDGTGSSDHVRVKGRFVVEADMASSDPTYAMQVKATNTTTDLFNVARSSGDGYFAGVVVADRYHTDTTSLRTKFRPYSADSNYGFGMNSLMSYGGLSDWALTFQMNTTSGRGFWWGTSAQANSQGVMALTNDGKLTVADSARIGYGTSDTTTPGASYALDITGGATIQSNVAMVSPDGNNTISMSMLDTDVLSFSGDAGQLFSISDDMSGTIFSVNDISGIPSIEVLDDGTITLAEYSGTVLVGTSADNGNTFQVAGTSYFGNTVYFDNEIRANTAGTNFHLDADSNGRDNFQFNQSGTARGQLRTESNTHLNLTTTGSVEWQYNGAELLTVSGNGASLTSVNAATLEGNTVADIISAAGGGSNTFDLNAKATSINIDTAYTDKLWSYQHATSTTDGTHPANYVMVTNLGGDSGQGTQIASAYGSSHNYYIRRGSDNAGSENGAGWQPWHTLWTSGNDGSGSNLDADTVDGIEGSSFLRSDAADTATGVITFSANGDFNSHVLVGDQVIFDNRTASDDHIRLYTGASEAASYGIGIESNTLYFRSATNYRWYRNTVADGGISDVMQLDATGLSLTGNLYASSSHTTNWFRSSGSTGWYNSTYGGGIYMDNGSYVKVYNNKNFWVNATSASTNTSTGALVVTGGTGIAGDIYAGANVIITNHLSAATKSFLIDHPTKENHKLRHGSLEGPENGVYVRGRLKGNNTIELPEYWIGLVDEDSITVELTPIGKHQKLYVEDFDNVRVIVGNDNLMNKEINCFYIVYGERKDVDKLEVEFSE